MIAGNWKMHKNQAETEALLVELKHAVGRAEGVDIVVCPPFTSLSRAVEVASGSAIHVGAQNIHWAANGAFTGEISADMLREIPVPYVIIGHSERRQYFGETDETVNGRLKAALAGELKPIVCVGETLAEREGGQTEKVIRSQIRDGLAGLANTDMSTVVIAYEPVWAIGTGKTATPAQAQQVHAFIRGLLSTQFTPEVARETRILYGGSVKADNAAELLGQPDIDGALVGGASLKAGDFAAIVQAGI
jgi:triosephosphate isomerase